MGLRPVTCKDCGFEFRRGHGSVAYCQIETWSPVRRGPTECGVSECDREAWTMWRPWNNRGSYNIANVFVGKENKYLILKEEYGFVYACKKAWLCDWPLLGLFISVFNQLDLFLASICFEHMCSSSGGQNCLWYHHTYRYDDTRGCVMQFWPPDDEHTCSKHVEARNKTYCETNFVHQVG